MGAADPILENVDSFFVQQFSIAGQVKAVYLEICPAIENCWTKPLKKACWKTFQQAFLLLPILSFLNDPKLVIVYKTLPSWIKQINSINK